MFSFLNRVYFFRVFSFIQSQTPSNPPEIRSYTPEIRSNTPEMRSNTPEIHSNTPEIHSNTPEIRSNTPEIHPYSLSTNIIIFNPVKVSSKQYNFSLLL